MTWWTTAHKRQTLVGVGVVAVVAFAAPFISFPHKSAGVSGYDCPSAALQIQTMEQYGDVTIRYYTYRGFSRLRGWYAEFETPYGSKIKVKLEMKADAMCKAVDDLYYKVQEFPLEKL